MDAATNTGPQLDMPLIKPDPCHNPPLELAGAQHFMRAGSPAACMGSPGCVLPPAACVDGAQIPSM